MMTLQQKISEIKKNNIFRNLADQDFQKIAEVAQELNCKSGQIIFEENEKADGFYIISKGEVEILKRGPDGLIEVLAVKKDGDVFGEMAVIDDLPRSATIRARTDIILLKLGKDIFNTLLKSFSHISLEISRSICYTVRATNENYIKDLEKRNRQLKNAYKKLKKTQNELIRVEKLSVVGKFASLIIHDIKNPLTNIRAYTELIQMNSTENKIRKSTQIIINEVDRLNKMASELLEFSRGDMYLEKTPINLTAFISTMIDMVKEELKKKNITLIFNEKIDCVVMLDMNKIKRVFLNLIKNSEDAILSDGKIIIKISDDGNWLKWTIQDNGIGMEPEILKKIFEPFFTYQKKNGTGLGMTIVKTIIEKHDGFIKVYSKKNSGTRFDIYLPKA